MIRTEKENVQGAEIEDVIGREKKSGNARRNEKERRNVKGKRNVKERKNAKETKSVKEKRNVNERRIETVNVKEIEIRTEEKDMMIGEEIEDIRIIISVIFI